MGGTTTKCCTLTSPKNKFAFGQLGYCYAPFLHMLFCLCSTSFFTSISPLPFLFYSFCCPPLPQFHFSILPFILFSLSLIPSLFCLFKIFIFIFLSQHALGLGERLFCPPFHFSSLLVNISCNY